MLRCCVSVDWVAMYLDQKPKGHCFKFPAITDWIVDSRTASPLILLWWKYLWTPDHPNVCTYVSLFCFYQWVGWEVVLKQMPKLNFVSGADPKIDSNQMKGKSKSVWSGFPGILATPILGVCLFCSCAHKRIMETQIARALRMVRSRFKIKKTRTHEEP